MHVFSLFTFYSSYSTTLIVMVLVVSMFFLNFPHICSCLWFSQQVLCNLYDVIQALRLCTKPFITCMSYGGFCIKIKVFCNNITSVGKYLWTFRRSLLLPYLGGSPRTEGSMTHLKSLPFYLTTLRPSHDTFILNVLDTSYFHSSSDTTDLHI
jgi:hypothetical protein